MQGTEIDRGEEIPQLAYKVWQEAGCPDGQEVQHWLKAEAIWLKENRPKSKPKRSKPTKEKKEQEISCR